MLVTSSFSGVGRWEARLLLMQLTLTPLILVGSKCGDPLAAALALSHWADFGYGIVGVEE